MTRNKGPVAADTPLAAARKRVLRAIDVLGSEAMTGSVIFRRMSDQGGARAAGVGADLGADRALPASDQSLLYPALHSLEADWKVQATWVANADGIRHRTYRRRRLLPRPSRAASR
jgi:hypothetical protein